MKAARGLLTRRELAARLDVVMMTITKWERDGCPIAKRGAKGRPSLYDLAAVQAWREAKAKAATPARPISLEQERARKERAQAVLAEQTYQIRSRELILLADAEREVGQALQALKTRLLSWAVTLADRLTRAAVSGGLPAVEHVIEGEVRLLLTELSRLDLAHEPATATGAGEEEDEDA